MCHAVNLRTSTYDVYIGRPGRGQTGPLGNPFHVGVHGQRGECVTLFRTWLYGQLRPRVVPPTDSGGMPRLDNGAPIPDEVLHDLDGVQFREKIQYLVKTGDRLGCFCKPNACHGDVIAEYVNNGYNVSC